MPESASRSCSFPREYRIVNALGYQAVRRSGRRIVTRHFILYVARAHTGVARLGVIASKKTGNAVRRNRHKRLVREVFRIHRGEFAAPVDVIVIIKKRPEAPDFKAYEQDLLYGISKGLRTLGASH